jgi:hypothetical protein
MTTAFWVTSGGTKRNDECPINESTLASYFGIQAFGLDSSFVIQASSFFESSVQNRFS